MPPIVTPVVVEADAKLLPSGDNWWEQHPLFKTYLPGMQDRIKEKMGVEVPEVAVRANAGDLSPNTYVFTIAEVPIVMGTVEPQRKFCPDIKRAHSILGTDLGGATLAFNPSTGDRDGIWVEQSRGGDFESDEARLWDYFEYMIRHLEVFLHDHLSSFVGVQEVQTMLDKWAGSNEDRRALCQEALPDDAAKVRLVQVLQGRSR